ncbi:MAG TPA: hypothetical protein VMF32_08355 [Xanthobacteraceae bacterium]|nr:hypothetical protein [Xanthobacteraceae bacterium]
MAEVSEPATLWWIEFENGNHSTAYASEAEAWAALMDFQSSRSLVSPQPNPVFLLSSTGLRFAVPIKS